MVRFPRISNATDVDAMAGETGVDVQVTTNPDTCQAADVLVLPGSRSTVSDLEWLRRSGIADVVARRAEQGRTVVGICGGYQMLCRTILDPDGQETTPGSVVEGLGLLPVEVDFAATKTLALSHGTWRGSRLVAMKSITASVVRLRTLKPSSTAYTSVRYGDDVARGIRARRIPSHVAG